MRQAAGTGPDTEALTFYTGGLQATSLGPGKSRSHLVTLNPGQADAGVGTWPLGQKVRQSYPMGTGPGQ